MSDHELSAEDALELENLERDLAGSFDEAKPDAAVADRLFAFASSIPEVLAEELSRLPPAPIKFCPIVSDPYHAIEAASGLGWQR